MHKTSRLPAGVALAVAAVVSGLLAPSASAAAEPLSVHSESAPAAGATGSSSADVFCTVIRILSLGHNADCSF